MNNNITIKAINSKMQLFILILNWIMPLLFAFTQINDLYGSINILIPWLLLCLGLTIWILSVKLIVENGHITYKSGFYKNEIKIDNIANIGTNFEIYGTSGQRDLIFLNAMGNKLMNFNIKYFGKKDLISFFELIKIENNQIIFDNSLKKEFNNL